MEAITYRWTAAGSDYLLELVHVAGTDGNSYSFGQRTGERPVDVPEFFIATVPVTQSLWGLVMGTNPSLHQGMNLPLENVSWDAISSPGGFLDRINNGAIRSAISQQLPGRNLSFRLPTETEWEYAARGGPHWRDGFPFSGSDDIEAVAWYDRRHGDHTQPVALKAPNQLGIYDMSGNVWEWCQDVFTPSVESIPANGEPFTGAGSDRVLRGGCFHNWAIHCTVWKRYEIAQDFHDGCIGLRLVLA